MEAILSRQGGIPLGGIQKSRTRSANSAIRIPHSAPRSREGGRRGDRIPFLLPHHRHYNLTAPIPHVEFHMDNLLPRADKKVSFVEGDGQIGPQEGRLKM